MKLSVCIDAVMQGVSVSEALARLKGIGVEAFEFWSWWDKDMDAVRAAAKETGLVPTAMCTKMISLTDPVQRSAYLDGLRESIAVAKALGCRTLISQTGNDTGAERTAQHESLGRRPARSCADFRGSGDYPCCRAAQHLCRPSMLLSFQQRGGLCSD